MATSPYRGDNGLVPCRRCGSSATMCREFVKREQGVEHWKFKASCFACGAATPWFSVKDEARKAWNVPK